MKLSHLHYASLGDDPYASPNQSQKVMREQENNLEDLAFEGHDCNQVHIVAIVLVTTGRGGRTRSHDGDY